MATTNLNIRTDKEIKDQAEMIFNELGLNMTTAINMFLSLGRHWKHEVRSKIHHTV